ncbi:MAG: lipopolysaccharide biosynthesis protein [Thermoplasmatota archaeon]
MAPRVWTALSRHWQRPLERNAYYLMLNSVVGAFAGFLFWLVAARYAPPAEVGVGAALISGATLAALLGKVGFDAALIRFVPTAGARTRSNLLLLALGASCFFSFALGAVMVTLAGRVALPEMGWSAGGGLAGPVFVFAGILTAAGWVFDAYFLSERRAGASLARNVVVAVAKVAFLPILLIGPFPAAYALLFAQAFALAASVGMALALSIPLLRQAPRIAGESPPMPVLLRYASLNYAANISEWMPSLVLPLLVVATLGPTANAAFYVGWTLAAIGLLASKAIAQSAFAEASTHGPPSFRRVYRAAMVQHALVLAPLGVALAVFAPFFLRFFGPGYVAAWPIIALVVASFPFTMVVNLRLTWLRASGGSAELIILPAATVGGALLLALPLMGLAGISGAALGWLVASIVASVVSFFRWPELRGFLMPASGDAIGRAASPISTTATSLAAPSTLVSTLHSPPEGDIP